MRQFERIVFLVRLAIGLLLLAGASVLGPTTVAGQGWGEDLAEEGFYEEDGLYEWPYEDDDGDYYDEPYEVDEEGPYEDGYTRLYDWYDWDRGWGYEEAEWWEDHPFYNEDEWYDPTDWFDGNNYEFDEEAYEASLRGRGYDVDLDGEEAYRD